MAVEPSSITADPEIFEQIVRFKEALARPEDASDSDAEDIGEAPTNRGNKLKRNARYVAWTAMKVPSPSIDIQLVEYGGEKRAVIYKRRRVLYKEDIDQAANPDQSHSDDDEEESDQAENADEILTVPIGALLKPIADPAELPTHPSLSRTFNSDTLRKLSRELLDTIVDEETYTVPMGNMLASLLGDDASVLRASNFEESEDFFAPPEITYDRDQGLPAEEAEELRQLFQLAYQRMQEYNRCLVDVRGSLTRADRLRRKVLNWCKELNGEDWVEQETGPDEYRIQQQMQQTPAQRLALAHGDGDDALTSAVSASEA